MGLTKYKLGELVEIADVRNRDVNNKYKEDDVKGISIDKIFIETKANLKNVSLSPYKLVQPHQFAYVTVTSRNGEKISLAYNQNEETYIVSSSYIVFKVGNKEILDPSFLFMYFNRPEFDRFSRFNSWGSARETFSWEDFCDIEINLPSIEIQKKYVAIYQAMLENQEAYEEGLEDLKLACDGTIENIRRKYKLQEIGCYIERIDERNKDNQLTNVKGLTVYKHFIDTKANLTNVSLKNYKIVRVGDIGYVPTTNRNGDRLACGLCNEECLISSIYEVIRPDNSKILSDYLFLWFRRSEFDRYVRYHSWGSARETFDFPDMEEFSIPIPPLEIQKSIANIYKVYTERKEINEKLKEQIKSICPILIKGAMEEADREEA
ncbi:restriction endonuclease subunit S [Campylobacter hominis]